MLFPCHSAGSCDIYNGGCEQECVATTGGKFCKCRDGYVQDPAVLTQCLGKRLVNCYLNT